MKCLSSSFGSFVLVVWVDGIIGKNEIKTERISWGSESKIANGKNTEFINRRSKLMND